MQGFACMSHKTASNLLDFFKSFILKWPSNRLSPPVSCSPNHSNTKTAADL